MSDYDKSTCPVCFTKMRNINKVPTCPDCGYKYCDHNRDLQNMFDTSHTHAPNYTTYTQNTTSYQNTSSQTSANSKNLTNAYSNSGKTTYTSTSSGRTTYNNSSSGQKSSNKNVGKIVKIIVIIYLLLMFCPIGCGVLFTAIGVIGEMADSDNTPEIHITSDLVEEELAVDALLSEMDADAPIELDAEDGEFVPELIKHIFDVDSIDEVTNEDISTVSYLDIEASNDNNVYVYYYTTGDAYGTFVYEGSEFDANDLNVFFGLECLYTPYTSYEEGDLANLPLLNTLSCQNSPAELTQVLNPAQLEYLTLILPEDATTLDGLEEFTGLGSLEIDTSYTELDDTSQIAELSNLYSFYYTDYRLETDYSFLNELTELEYLYLCTPGLTDLSFVENMSNLRSLQLEDCLSITDLSPLTNIADTLTTLDLSYCYEIEDFSTISELYSLHYLGLDGCSVETLDFASDLDNLNSLSISDLQLDTLEPVKDLPNLEYIYAWNSTINDYAGLQDIIYE